MLIRQICVTRIFFADFTYSLLIYWQKRQLNKTKMLPTSSLVRKPDPNKSVVSGLYTEASEIDK